jgi:hypothetical protein
MGTSGNRMLEEFEKSIEDKRADIRITERQIENLKKIDPSIDPCLSSKINNASNILAEKKKRLAYFEKQYLELKKNFEDPGNQISIRIDVSYAQFERIKTLANIHMITREEVILKGLELMEKQSPSKGGKIE